MSREALTQVAERARTDGAFLEQLRSDPERAAAGYELTAEERETLVGAVRATLAPVGELSDAAVEGVSGGLVVNNIIAVLIGLLLPDATPRVWRVNRARPEGAPSAAQGRSRRRMARTEQEASQPVRLEQPEPAPQPAETELSDKQLAQVAGGYSVIRMEGVMISSYSIGGRAY
jgi:hypothetical protein